MWWYIAIASSALVLLVCIHLRKLILSFSLLLSVSPWICLPRNCFLGDIYLPWHTLDPFVKLVIGVVLMPSRFENPLAASDRNLMSATLSPSFSGRARDKPLNHLMSDSFREFFATSKSISAFRENSTLNSRSTLNSVWPENVSIRRSLSAIRMSEQNIVFFFFFTKRNWKCDAQIECGTTRYHRSDGKLLTKQTSVANKNKVTFAFRTCKRYANAPKDMWINRGTTREEEATRSEMRLIGQSL